MKLEKNWFSPCESIRRIGSVIEVSPTELKVNLSKAGSGEPSWSFGNRIGAGEVNEFIFIDVGATVVLGRLVKVWIEGGERLSVDSSNYKAIENHPIGIIQLLVSIDPTNGHNYKGIKQYPRLGAQIYSAHPDLVSILIESKERDSKESIYLELASLGKEQSSKIHITPEKLFSRHCAILGSTGGGKSYSMMKIIEEVKKLGGKALIIDPTGEYNTLDCESYYVGEHEDATQENKVTFPHWQFSEQDIFAFLRPSAQSQAPKLASAIVSQKLVAEFELNTEFNLNLNNSLLLKAGSLKDGYYGALAKIKDKLSKLPWSFSLTAEQIEHECVYINGYNGDSTKWGARVENEVGYCHSLISRMKSYTNNPSLKWMIDPDTILKTIPDIINDFCNSSSNIIRLDLSAVPFEANAREILVNAIGRKLLSLARAGSINYKKPLLVFIDEAHQFLNKQIGSEDNRFELDAFGNIAKEGRKYGLNTIIATQRPRDIPEDVLSQIGTLIVHRLTNKLDQDIVKRAVGSIDQRSASFLPTLSQGEALLLGVDFSFPMAVQMDKPKTPPESKSANFSSSWGKQ